MKRLATIGAVGTIIMLSGTPITIAHADPIANDTLTINGNAVLSSMIPVTGPWARRNVPFPQVLSRPREDACR